MTFVTQVHSHVYTITDKKLANKRRNTGPEPFFRGNDNIPATLV